MEEQSKVNTGANKLTNLLFIIYLIALIWILLLKLGVRFSYIETRRINLIPFAEPVILNGKVDFNEIILNVVIFVPLGIYVGILFKRWILGKKFFTFFLISLLVEGLQYRLAIGSFDITDLITNTLGGVTGLIIYKAIEKVFDNSGKAQKFINIIAAIGTTLIILFLLLLKMNMLPIRYQ